VCGIAAVLMRTGDAELASTIDAMTDALAHRGPDDRGTVVLGEQGVALGMRRLSIVDLAGGHQPMRDENLQLNIVFNGEIYNHLELRKQLIARGHRFRTDHSDTEVLLRGYAEWKEDVFHRLNGMFAVAIWDGRRGEMVLARDRMGKKPLYIAKSPSGYLVASELKSIMTSPSFKPQVDPEGLHQYLSYDHVLAPNTILQDVQQLPAANWAVLTSNGVQARAYWEPVFSRSSSSEPKAIATLDAALDEAVRTRMVADVLHFPSASKIRRSMNLHTPNKLRAS
jgi:asparagine synthase (glutamine-hydrolysing)